MLPLRVFSLLSLFVVLGFSSAFGVDLPDEAEGLIFKLEVYEQNVHKKLGTELLADRKLAIAALQKQMDEASKAERLEDALALRAVLAALGEDKVTTDLDKTANLPPGAVSILRTLRAEELRASTAAVKAIDAKSEQVVAVLDRQVKDLTKAGRLDDAAAVQGKVKTMKEGLAERAPPKLGERAPTLPGMLPLGTSLVKGLATYEFAKLEKQKDDNTRGIHYGEFGKAVSKRKISKAVKKWKWNSSRNAVAIGFLKIEEAGEYSFSTYNWWDRNALYVLDLTKPLCGYRDHGAKHTIKLEAGYVPIIAVGYPEAKGDFGYAGWKPPGAEKHENIPDAVLFHSRDMAEEIIRKIEGGE